MLYILHATVLQCKIEHHLGAHRFYLLINAPTCFGLAVSHVQGAFFRMYSLCFNLHVAGSTYNYNYFYDDQMLQFLKSV